MNLHRQAWGNKHQAEVCLAGERLRQVRMTTRSRALSWQDPSQQTGYHASSVARRGHGEAGTISFRGCGKDVYLPIDFLAFLREQTYPVVGDSGFEAMNFENAVDSWLLSQILVNIRHYSMV